MKKVINLICTSANYSDLYGMFYKFSCVGEYEDFGEYSYYNKKGYTPFKELRTCDFISGDYVVGMKYQFVFSGFYEPLFVNKLKLKKQQLNQEKIIITNYQELKKLSKHYKLQRM